MNSAETDERPEGTVEAFVRDLRAEISEIDRTLLDGVNRRLEIVRRLHDHKIAHGMPLRDPEREASLLERLVAENGGPLSASGVAEFFDHLLALVRRELHGE